ncbi:MAG: GNAT family N-acetyltransferase [Pseudolabrys sp.]
MNLFDDPALTAGGVSLRAACDSDAAFFRALFETARPDAAVLAAWPAATRQAFLDQQFHFQTVHYARAYPGADRLVIVKDGAPIGRLILARELAEWCVIDIALLPAWRSTGLGTVLLRCVQAAAGQARACGVQLTVDMQNPARRLYERLGFAVADEAIPNVIMVWLTPAAQLKTA